MNNTVLIIGASGGIGKQLAKDLLDKGNQLALHYFSKPDELKNNFEESDTLKFYQADITSENEVSDLIKKVLTDFGKIDVLVNNAGITRSNMAWNLTDDDWKDTLNVNLTGSFYTIKHVLPSMRENNYGRIINITSVVAQKGIAGTSAYAASKAGLIGMTKSIAKEVANKNITANCLALGYFKAGMLYEVPEDYRELIKKEIPKNEFGNPSVISNCVLYLCSEHSEYVTGQTINLNGGLHT